MNNNTQITDLINKEIEIRAAHIKQMTDLEKMPDSWRRGAQRSNLSQINFCKKKILPLPQ